MRSIRRISSLLTASGTALLLIGCNGGAADFSELEAYRHIDEVTMVTFAGLDRCVTTEFHTMRLLDLASRKEVALFGTPRRSKPTPAVGFVVASSDGTSLLSAGPGARVELWDLQKMKVKHTFVGHQAYVTCIALSPDGRFAAAGTDTDLSRNGSTEDYYSIFVWDCKSGERIWHLRGHDTTVLRLAFLPDSTRLVDSATLRL